MKIKPELEKQIRRLLDAGFNKPKQIDMPCCYFNELANATEIPSKVSCADCRAEDMYFDEDGSVVIDCYALMIIDFLKSCGVEVEGES